MSARPPSNEAVGNAGWTLIHTMAAKYPEKPSDSDQYHAKAFLNSISVLYPCKKCRYHFSKYLHAYPPDVSSRERFVLWACAAHNDVNRRTRKSQYSCRLKDLDARWGDCGCARRRRSAVGTVKTGASSSRK